MSTWEIAGYCMYGVHCPAIVGPVLYRILGDWRFDLTALMTWEGEGGR